VSLIEHLAIYREHKITKPLILNSGKYYLNLITKKREPAGSLGVAKGWFN
jgi:hypothetical protein